MFEVMFYVMQSISINILILYAATLLDILPETKQSKNICMWYSENNPN